MACVHEHDVHVGGRHYTDRMRLLVDWEYTRLHQEAASQLALLPRKCPYLVCDYATRLCPVTLADQVCGFCNSRLSDEEGWYICPECPLREQYVSWGRRVDSMQR
jgi:hypothetical protein